MADRFRQLRASAAFTLGLQAHGPILVKGPEAISPERPDMSFVRYPTEWGEAPFVPGSSVKGVLRSGSEALLRGVGLRVCDPFDVKNGQPQCLREWGGRCSVCLVFGSVLGAGHLMVEDFLPWPPNEEPDQRRSRVALASRRSVIRSGVAIDRQTGASSPQRLFDYEVLVDVAFWGRLVLRNPEQWHLATVGAALTLLDDGLLRVGSGTTRGLGRVRVVDRGVVLRAVSQRELQRLVGEGPFEEPRREGFWWAATATDAAAARAWLAGRLEEVAGDMPLGRER